MLSNLPDLLLVVLGFSFIIFVHELGHFAAARWAGVRVLAFAIGMGPALVSYRRGLGLRRGSSEAAYRKMAHERADQRGLVPGVSATEYRLNALPIGGYVKMLGQDDADPSHRSEAPDSYNRASVPRRMVIISAGVVMNLILAAALFVVVFTAGLRTESAKIGGVVAGSGASEAEPVNAPGVAPGLRAGDTIVAINGQRVEAFKDVILAGAMAAKDATLLVDVARPARGSEPARTISFRVKPRVDEGTRMLSLGVFPGHSGALVGGVERVDRQDFVRALAQAGLPASLEPGMRLTGGETYEDLVRRAEASGGAALDATFEPAPGGAGVATRVRIQPEPVYMRATATINGAQYAFEHLLGLVAPMRAARVNPDATTALLKDGDVFARVGDAEFPSMVEGVRALRAAGNGTIELTVLRRDEAGAWQRVALGAVPVRNGRIGFAPDTSAGVSGLLAAFPASAEGAGAPARALGVLSGSTLLAVNGRAVASLHEAREAVVGAAREGTGELALSLTIAPPGPEGKGSPERVEVRLSEAERAEVARLGWELPPLAGLFDSDYTLLQRSSPIDAVGKGASETWKMVLTTYLTLARLFQGTVKVEHLQGPIGIAHVGTKIAGRGTIWLLFFMAAISVNLAVINFLPMPIVDGGHFVFLCYEGLTGKPVSVLVQNVATIAGLVLIGSVFLITTYNDIARLILG
jgi:regulator of sigma E protease